MYRENPGHRQTVCRSSSPSKNNPVSFLRNHNGFGLIAAIFVIVILATFGLLVARFTGTGSLQAAEDYVWAQALYSAQSGIRLRILSDDGGGALSPWPGYPSFSQCTLQELNHTVLPGPETPTTIRVSATRGNIVRILEVNYIL
jgi:hypothetical protein